MTPAEFSQYLEIATTAADIALPLAGQADLVPIANAASTLIQKIATVVQERSGDATVAATMAAARLAADVQENLKFPAKS